MKVVANPVGSSYVQKWSQRSNFQHKSVVTCHRRTRTHSIYVQSTPYTTSKTLKSEPYSFDLDVDFKKLFGRTVQDFIMY